MLRKKTVRALWIATVVCLLAVSGRPSEPDVRDDHASQIEAATDARVTAPIVRRTHAVPDGHVRPLVFVAPAEPPDAHVARVAVLVEGDRHTSRHVTSFIGFRSSRGPPRG